MEENKWKYSPIRNEDISLEDAIKLLQYPKFLGTYNKAHVYLHKGQYGLYLKCSNRTVSIKDTDKDIDNIDLEYAKSLLDSGDPYSLKSFKLKDNTINIKKGPYGYYAQITSKGKSKKKNVSLPDELDPNEITLEQLLNTLGIKPKKSSTSD